MMMSIFEQQNHSRFWSLSYTRLQQDATHIISSCLRLFLRNSITVCLESFLYPSAAKCNKHHIFMSAVVFEHQYHSLFGVFLIPVCSKMQ
jgi:hypothetical protein